MISTRTSAALAAAFLLAACISFGGKPPPTLLSLTPEVVAETGTTQRAGDKAVAVFVPTVPQSLTTTRIPVQINPNEIAYLPNAMWVDAPPKLFRALLAETITARTRRVTLDARGFAMAPAARLAGTLDRFGLDAASGSVVVRYDATLVRGDGASLEARRFEARVPAAAQSGVAVAAALNRAANQVAIEVADWVGG